MRLGCLEIGVFVYFYTYTFLDISICSFQCTMLKLFASSGDGEIRTLDPLLARQVLSQLSYAPIGLTI